MAEIEDLLTLAEAAELVDIGQQTLRKAVGTPQEPGELRVAKWAPRGAGSVPHLIYRDDVMEYKANRPGKGFASMDKHYQAVMQTIATVLTEAQTAKVSEVLPFETYKRLHYSAGK